MKNRDRFYLTNRQRRFNDKKTPVSLELLGAAGFMVIADVRVIDPLLRVTQHLPKQQHQTPSPVGLATFKPYYQLMQIAIARTIIIGVFIEGFFVNGAFAYLGAFLRDKYNLPYLAIGFMLCGFGLGGLIYSGTVKWLVRKLGERGLIAVGGWLLCAGYLSIAAFHNWMLFILLSILMGLGFYMMHSTLQTKATELSPEARGTAVSLFVFSLFMGQGIGAAVFGRIVDNYGYIPCFIIAGIATALLWVWLVMQNKHVEFG